MFEGNHTQNDLPAEIFNASNGDIRNYNGHAVQIYNNGNGTRKLVDLGDYSSYQAQKDYKTATDTAISGLQQKKTDLAGQYSDLLKTVTQEYTPLINQTTATAGDALAKRGLTPDSQLFQTQTQGAVAPVYGQEAANAQQIGQGSITDTNTLAAGIANLQAGAAGTASQIPLQYGSLATTTALNQAQGSYYSGQNANTLAVAQLGASKPFGVGNLVFNPSTNQYAIPKTGGGGNQPNAASLALAKLNSKQRPSNTSIGQFVRPA